MLDGKITSKILCVLALSSALIACDNSTSGDTETKASVESVDAANTKILFNDGWYFVQDESASPPAELVEDQWQAINLPHTWNATDTVDAVPGYSRRAGWYRKTFRAGAQGRYRLVFEGANMETQVFLNGQQVGEHIGGYLGFAIELSQGLRFNDNNELWVRVSNRYNPNLIPSQKADFFIHGGITRDVWLEQLPPLFIDQLSIRTPAVSAEQATTELELVFDDQRPAPVSVELRVRVVSPAGEEIISQQQTVSEFTNSLLVSLPAVHKPALWSPTEPQLHRLHVQLFDEQGREIFQREERFGYRWFEMRDNEGFFVNGQRLLLRGTHRHEEHAGVGAAMSNQQHRRDMEQMKSLGVNFVRLGHYPQDPEVYRAADELGLILWDELPWCRGGKGGAEWEQNTERLLRQQILQNMNHPSIAFWSLGNEIYWESDFVGGGDDAVILPYLEKLQALAKRLDPDRMTSIRKYYPGAKVVDAFSPSIWAGWYGGAFGQYETALQHSMQQYPRFLHMEYGGSSHRGRHTEQALGPEGLVQAQVSVEEAMNQAVVTSIAKDTDWNENYMVNLFDWHLSVSEKLPGFAGNAQWAFKDFGTPLRPENPLPYVNQKGLVDRAGAPKDAYYVFASYWSPTPMCYIESHTWAVRYGPSAGRPVKVFCNTHSAELFLNDKSLGALERKPGHYPAHGLVWLVPFREGDNQLQVLGFDDEQQEVARDAMALTYHVGAPGSLEAVVLSAQTGADGESLIVAEAVDKQGRRVVDYSERAYFSVLQGDGQLLENQGTYTGSSTLEMASGMGKIVFKPGRAETVVEFRTQNVKGVYIRLPGTGP
ncbi:glycoside hydrolase family 2 TIM barrel-domain containing protein [Simiduia curdlanivorans]|uniref:Glycoside hydrolase family 2 TIM barrel-domain containing protein n=1 Tax=Simiduia curdlanivorans TaxID=1492769 RepID=A0ABV8V1C6_9GAMM|nr:glycoside hydrolase family 2 TIM barrel-domain containing protein [Simiduia curdlanivorans]MDN3637503.1 glycoside hydrolase family 2 TIM barrel-domain containing protein [Simiduia curdlanivorans]